MARPLCDDWSCPAKASCAHHWGRSAAYWSMSDDPDWSRQFRKGDRRAWEESCADYRRDQVRPWMVEAYQPLAPAPEGAWRMPLFVSPFADGGMPW